MAHQDQVSVSEPQPLLPVQQPLQPEPETDHKPLDKDPPSVPEPIITKPIPLNVDDDLKPGTTTAPPPPPPPVDLENRALSELKLLVQDALNNHHFTSAPKEQISHNPSPPPAEEAAEPADPEAQLPKTEDVVAVAVTPVRDEHIEEDEKVADSGSVAVDDDGAKTVEAIEETIVAVSASPALEDDSSPGTEQDQQDKLKLSDTPTEEKLIKEAIKEDKDEDEKDEKAPVLVPEEVSIWGIPLMADERTDTILLKFLRARDFKVKEAFSMIKNTIRWRKEFGIEELVEEKETEEDRDLNKVVFMKGSDKEGHPVCYNVYGEFQNKELYQKTFSDQEKRLRFLRWRIRFLEKSIRKLDFTPGGAGPCTIVQVNDLKNSPGPAKWELRQATKQALQLLQDNYPEFVAKQVFINVPWWYLAVNRMISPFLTERTKSKFVFAGPSKSAETLFRYIAAEQVPVKYGGLSKDGDFGSTDAVTEITLKPSAKHTLEFPVTESCVLSWEVRVVGWEVSYGAEFVPNGEGSYTVIIQKSRKVGSNEEPVICNSFKVDEPGKVVITIDNSSSKKKKLLYRLKTEPSSLES